MHSLGLEGGRSWLWAMVIVMLALSACESVTGSEEETEYQGSLSGQLIQTTDNGNGIVCTATHAVSGTVEIKLRPEGAGVRGQGELSATGTPVAVTGGPPNTGTCSISGTPPLTIYFRGGVTGTLSDLSWSQTQTGTTADGGSSTQTLAFTGSGSTTVLNGTLTYNQRNQHTVVNCAPTTGCFPPRTVISTVSWTTNVSVTAD